MTKNKGHRGLLRLGIRSLLPPATVLAVHLVKYAFYPFPGTWDVGAHFVGGFSIAWMAHIFFGGLKARGVVPVLPAWLNRYLLISSVFVAGVVWEFYEWASDSFLGTTTQFTIPETMGDLLMDVSGGALFLAILFVIGLNKNRRGQIAVRGTL